MPNNLMISMTTMILQGPHEWQLILQLIDCIYDHMYLFLRPRNSRQTRSRSVMLCHTCRYLGETFGVCGFITFRFDGAVHGLYKKVDMNNNTFQDLSRACKRPCKGPSNVLEINTVFKGLLKAF